MTKGKLRKFRPSQMYCYDLCSYLKIKYMIRLIKSQKEMIKSMNTSVKIIFGLFINALRLKGERTMVSAVTYLVW